MSAERHLTWENFERDILRPAVPAKHPVPGEVPLHLFFLPDPPRIGLRIPIGAPLLMAPSAYREIEVAVQSHPDGLALAAWTTNEALFKPFFFVLLEIADAVQLEHVPPADAVQIAIQRFTSLVRRDAYFTFEQVIGLWGELIVLERLVRAHGPDAITAWTGWTADQHDFRMEGIELEIKTTVAAEPEHLINGIQQLVPSEQHLLFIVSLQLMRSPSGHTLEDRVRCIEALLPAGSVPAIRFAEGLQELGVTSARLSAGVDRLLLRRKPWLVPVDTTLPAITPSVLENSFASEALARLRELHYRLNVSGLACDPSTPRFPKAMSWMISDDD